MTAIGKLCKPALRARACGRALRERIERAGLQSQLGVRVDDEAGGLPVVFQTLPGNDAEPVRDRIATLMQGIALRYSLQTAATAASGPFAAGSP